MSSSEEVDDQHKLQRMMKKFMNNKVKGLKEKMSELVASSNCQKMKSWSENIKLEVVHALRKFKGKNNKIEKKKKKNHEEKTEKYDETTATTRVSSSSSMKEDEEELMLSKDSMLKRLSKMDEKFEKIMERVGLLETVVERLAKKCSSSSSSVEDEEEQMSDSDESGYCTPVDLD